MAASGTDRPLISVVVPAFNVESRINRCIASIVGQTYTCIEVIIVDDGSTDATPSLCDSWAQRDARVRVIHQQNRGLSIARNVGIDASRGDYLAFVDSDDYVEAAYIARLLDVLLGAHADLSMCAPVCEASGGGPSVMRKNAPVYPGICSGSSCCGYLTKSWAYVVAWNKLYRRSLWDGLRYPAGKRNEDEFIAHLLFVRARMVAATDEALYHYVDNPQGIMSQPYSLANLDRSEAFARRASYFANLGLMGPIGPTLNGALHDLSLSVQLDWGDPAVKARAMEIAQLIEAVPAAALSSVQRLVIASLRASLYSTLSLIRWCYRARGIAAAAKHSLCARR